MMRVVDEEQGDRETEGQGDKETWRIVDRLLVIS
jgi:hypothetical protein